MKVKHLWLYISPISIRHGSLEDLRQTLVYAMHQGRGRWTLKSGLYSASNFTQSFYPKGVRIQPALPEVSDMYVRELDIPGS
jgi:hypothetical protein